MLKRAITLGALPLAALLLGAASPADVPPTTEFVFGETVLLAADIKVGKTPYGERNIVPITGGTFEGPTLKGTIIPGGWDWQLSTGGCFRLEANYMIRTDDGAVINVINKGTSCRELAKPDARMITVPMFEAPAGRYAWLNDGAYLGTLEVTRASGQPAVKIRIFKAK
jgi:hypothetical protein